MIAFKVERGAYATPVFGEEKKLLLMALKRGVASSTDELKTALRQSTMTAQLGDRLSKAWRSEVYPGGRQGGTGATESLAYSPAGMVWSRATDVFMTHITGATITPSRRKYLAVPVKEVQDAWRSRGFTHRDGRQGQARGTAANAGQYAAIDMQTWAARNGTTLRIVWNKKPGKIAAFAVSNKDNKVKFFLMRSVTLRPRLEIATAFNRVSSSFPRKLQDDVRRVLDGLNNR